MTALLALFFRSVRDDVRSKSLTWARLAIAVTVVFSIFKVRSFDVWMGGAQGLSFFSSVVWMNFVFICVAALSYFASAVTEEKEEGTLGLLRMTDLSPFAILLGKSTSRLIGGVTLLGVQLPFAMLAITLGGVHMNQVTGCYLILAAFLFFACNVGLLGSVFGRRTGTASVFTGLIGGGYLLLPTIASWVIQGQGREVTPALMAKIRELQEAFFTPMALSEVLGNRSGTASPWPAVTTLLIGGVVAFLLARVCFESFCGDEEATGRAAPKTPSRPAQGGAAPAVSAPIATRHGRAWADAICWRDFYFLHGGWFAFVLKSAIYLGGAVWIGSVFSSSTGFYRSNEMFCGMIFFWACIVTGFDSLFATSRIFKSEKRGKTLASLYTLPQDMDALIRSKRKAVVLAVLPSLIYLVIFGIILFFMGIGEIDGEGFFYFLCVVAYAIAQVFMNHYLVAYLSLCLKWGGLPVSLGISWLGNMMGAFVLFMMFQQGGFVFIVVASVFAAIILRRRFRDRLEKAMGEE